MLQQTTTEAAFRWHTLNQRFTVFRWTLPPRWISELHLTEGVITKSTFRAVCPERRWKTWICRKTLFTADPGRVTFVVFVKCPEQIFQQIKVLSFSIGFSSVFILFKPIINNHVSVYLTLSNLSSSPVQSVSPPSSSLLLLFSLFFPPFSRSFQFLLFLFVTPAFCPPLSLVLLQSHCQPHPRPHSASPSSSSSRTGCVLCLDTASWFPPEKFCSPTSGFRSEHR